MLEIEGCVLWDFYILYLSVSASEEHVLISKRLVAVSEINSYTPSFPGGQGERSRCAVKVADPQREGLFHTAL